MAVRGMRGSRGGSNLADYAEEQKKSGRKADARTVRRIMLAFQPYKLQVILVLIAIIVTTLLGLVNPLLIQRIFDDAIGKGNVTLLIIYVVIMFVTPIVSGIIGVGQSYLNNRIGQNVMHSKFGPGVIVDAEGQGGDARVQVNFGKQGVKWLAVAVAKLQAA